MTTKNKQVFIRKTELFIDLKELINKYNVSKAGVIFNSDFNENSLGIYLKKMDVDIAMIDFCGVSYRQGDIESLKKTIALENIDLIIAAGDGALINAVKYLRLNNKMQNIPVIAVPSHVEAGDEANGRIISFNSSKVSTMEEESVVPEYVFYDPDFVRSDSKYDINSHFARGICQAMNIMWTNDPDSPAAQAAAKGLSILLANATKIMRGERSSLAAAFEGARSIGQAVGLAERKSLDELAMYLSSSCDLNLGHAMMKLAAPTCVIFEDYLRENGMIRTTETHFNELDADNVSDKHEEVYRKLRSIMDIVAPGAGSISSLNYQVGFLERALELFSSDLSDEEILDLADRADRSIFRDCPLDMSDEAIRLLFLHVFHRETIKRSIDKYQLHIDLGERPGRNTNNILALKERYADDLSDDRIIPEPYYECQMQRRQMVKGLQKDVLETLLLSKDLLEKYGLRYYLSEGTLLGAVRHRGFIPWDDDVDIMMPREDYNKLVELDKNGLIPPELHLDALENNPKHWVLGAKLQLTRKSVYVQSKVTELSEYNGPYIDVFPLDYWNSPYSKKQYRAQRMVKMCRRLLFLKTGYSRKLKKKPHRFLMLLAIPFIPNTAIERFAIKNMTRFNNGNRKYMVHLCSYYRFYKEVFPTGFYGDPVYMEFEGHEFPVPKEYDYMLRTIYGNHYDSLPPARVAGLRNHPFEVVEDLAEE